MDEIDVQLLALLRENARAPVSDLGRKLGVARTTVQARMERLERRGVITGYSVRTAPDVAPSIRATALLSIEPRSAPAVLDRLRKLPNVEAVHTASGRWDLIVQLSADRTEALDDALDRIGEARGVRSSESLIHLATKIDRRP